MRLHPEADGEGVHHLRLPIVCPERRVGERRVGVAGAVVGELDVVRGGLRAVVPEDVVAQVKGEQRVLRIHLPGARQARGRLEVLVVADQRGEQHEHLDVVRRLVG